jgi:hypothetical protein
MGLEVINGLIKILVIFFIFGVVFTPSASAWHWNTHKNIAEGIYNSMPADVQHNLNLSEMRIGAAAPDLVFKDNKYKGHRYPKTYLKAVNWLKKGKTAYQEGYYNNASYCFGVASHYISDSYVAPHCANSSKSAHRYYEKRAKNMKPSAVCYMNESLKSSLAEAYKTGEARWGTWLENRNMTLVQQDLNNATSIAYSAIRKNV